MLAYVNHVLSLFADAGSVFNFYSNYVMSNQTAPDDLQKDGFIKYNVFAEATKSLLSSTQTSVGNLRMLFELICKGYQIKRHDDFVFGKTELKNFFKDANFTGSIKNVQRQDKALVSIGRKGQQAIISKSTAQQPGGKSDIIPKVANLL